MSHFKKNDNGEWLLPPTQRPNGTWRKPQKLQSVYTIPAKRDDKPLEEREENPVEKPQISLELRNILEANNLPVDEYTEWYKTTLQKFLDEDYKTEQELYRMRFPQDEEESDIGNSISETPDNSYIKPETVEGMDSSAETFHSEPDNSDTTAAKAESECEVANVQKLDELISCIKDLFECNEIIVKPSPKEQFSEEVAVDKKSNVDWSECVDNNDEKIEYTDKTNDLKTTRAALVPRETPRGYNIFRLTQQHNISLLTRDDIPHDEVPIRTMYFYNRKGYK